MPVRMAIRARTRRAVLARLALATAVFQAVLGQLCASASAGAERTDRPFAPRAHANRVDTAVGRTRLRRARVVAVAHKALGVPYRWGGASPASGFDCSGLVQWAYRQVGVRLPHYSYGQWRYGRPVSRRGLRAGDLVFFSGLGHVGIYIGHNRLIHAPHAGARVSVAPLSGWYARSFVGGRRLVA
jgi:cell wall-associated NlpC family hydrolase